MSEEKNLTAESFDITIHLQKGNRVYRLTIPYGAPFDETHAVIKDLGNHIEQMQAKAKDLAEKQEAELKAKESEEVVVEVIEEAEVCNG